MKAGEIKFSWLGLTAGRRMDAGLWTKVLEVAKARSIDPETDLDAFGRIAREVDKRGEIPTGTFPSVKKAPSHKECPKCLSWEVNSTETSTVKAMDGNTESEFNGVYVCRNCAHEWTRSEKGSPASALAPIPPSA